MSICLKAYAGRSVSRTIPHVEQSWGVAPNLMKENAMNRHRLGFKKEAEPFFSIVMEGLKDAVDGQHFWDAVAEDAVFEFTYNFPGFTNKIEGKNAYRKWFEGYGMVLHSADNLRVYKVQDAKTVILEYEVHGVVSATGKKYDNRFCSIITIEKRKIVQWRDYMDSLAVMLSCT